MSSSFKRRKEFRNLQQLVSKESINQWFKRVKKDADDCDFGDYELEERIKEQFVLGMEKGQILDRMLKENPRLPQQDIVKVALKMEKELQIIQKLPDRRNYYSYIQITFYL